MNSDEIRAEIIRLEKEETTYQNCSKLAVLYSVIEHLGKQEPAEYSYGESEFLTVVSQAPLTGVMEILDEHMNAVQVLYPKEYTALIRRMKELSLP